jgi:tyrosine-protein phosphatase SIW14
MKKKLYLIVIFSLIVFSFSFADTPYNHLTGDRKPADKINVRGFRNIYKINESLYRSEQPDKKGMKELQKIGVRTILDLRSSQNDQRVADDTKLVLEHVPINTWKISYNDILKSLRIISHSEKPVLIHCLHGSDRTGCIIAAYRMVYENWSKDEAINEFLDKDYGYHEKWFPNILALLRSLDIDLLKKDLGIEK